MPDMPADGQRGVDRLDVAVKLGLHLVAAPDPQVLPGEQLGIVEENAPEGGEVAVARRLGRTAGADIPLQFAEAPPGPLDIDPGLPPLLLAEFTKAGGLPWIGPGAVVVGAERVEEPALALRAPHHPANVIGAGVVLHQPAQPGAVVGVVLAGKRHPLAVKVDLGELLPDGDRRRAMIVLEDEGEDLDAVLGGGRDHPGEDVDAAEFRRLHSPRTSGSSPCSTAGAASRSCRRGSPGSAPAPPAAVLPHDGNT